MLEKRDEKDEKKGGEYWAIRLRRGLEMIESLELLMIAIIQLDLPTKFECMHAPK